MAIVGSGKKQSHKVSIEYLQMIILSYVLFVFVFVLFCLVVVVLFCFSSNTALT